MPDPYILKYNDKTLVVRADSVAVLRLHVLEQVGFSATRVTIEDIGEPSTDAAVAVSEHKRGRPRKPVNGTESAPSEALEPAQEGVGP